MVTWKSYGQIGLWSILVLLWVPSLCYSLQTPFALIDDYNSWMIVRKFGHVSGIFTWWRDTWFHGQSRVRITYDLYNLLTWWLLDGSSWAHHGMRWVLKGVVAWSTFNILRLMMPVRQPAGGLPFWVFCVIFGFFPNNPEARLAPVELLTVTLLALLLYEFGRLCVCARGDLAAISPLRYLWVFCVFTAMLWAKETNIVMGAVMLVMLICLNPKRWMRVLPFAGSALITGIRVWAVSQSGGYGTAPVTGALIKSNFSWCLKSLFLWQTSLVCAGLLVIPVLVGVWGLVQKTLRYSRNGQGGFVGMVGKEQADLKLIFYWLVLANALAYFVITLTAWLPVLRYFYPLVYMLALFVGLTMLVVEELPFRRRMVVTGLTIGAAVYFIGANYYNYVYQFACQYYTRIVEYDVLRTADKLLQEGRTVNLAVEEEFEYKIVDYFNDYLPFYKQTNYRITPCDPNANIQKLDSYFISRHAALPAGYQLYHCFDGRHVSKMLWWCDRLSSWFQFSHPAFYWWDAGASDIGRHGENITRWYISVCRGQ